MSDGRRETATACRSAPSRKCSTADGCTTISNGLDRQRAATLRSSALIHLKGRMALALRSARFTTDHGTLEIRECADCTQVQILVESGPPLATDTHVLTLTADEWGQLTRLPYVDRCERERHDQPPDNVLETFLLMDEQTSFEIRERRDRRSVLIV